MKSKSLKVPDQPDKPSLRPKTSFKLFKHWTPCSVGKMVADKPLTLKDRSADFKPGGKSAAVRRDDESSERNNGHIMQKKGEEVDDNDSNISHANYSQALTGTSSPEVAIYHYLAISNYQKLLP